MVNAWDCEFVYNLLCALLHALKHAQAERERERESTGLEFPEA